MTGDDRLTEAAHHAAHALADARARLLRLRAACDFGIARIEAGEAPPPLAARRAPRWKRLLPKRRGPAEPAVEGLARNLRPIP